MSLGYNEIMKMLREIVYAQARVASTTLPVATNSSLSIISCRHFHEEFLFRETSLNVRFEAFKAVTMKNVVFWDVIPCGSCKCRRFGGTYRLHN
jgi:hypothetical protein